MLIFLSLVKYCHVFPSYFHLPRQPCESQVNLLEIMTFLSITQFRNHLLLISFKYNILIFDGRCRRDFTVTLDNFGDDNISFSSHTLVSGWSSVICFLCAHLRYRHSYNFRRGRFCFIRQLLLPPSFVNDYIISYIPVLVVLSFECLNREGLHLHDRMEPANPLFLKRAKLFRVHQGNHFGFFFTLFDFFFFLSWDRPSV